MPPAKDTTHDNEPVALSVTRWVGSSASLLMHSAIFIGSFALAYFGIVEWERTLLVVTTLVSLEAIYLSIFIQMSLNHANSAIDEVEEDIDEIQKDIDEIQEDVDEIQKDVDEIEEAEEEGEERQEEQQKTLASIEKGLAKLLEDIEKLKDNQKR